MRPAYATIPLAICTMALVVSVVPEQAAFAEVSSTSRDPAMQTDHVKSVRELSLSAAQKLLSKGLEFAAERGMKLGISVVDRAGNLLAFARMDSAAIVTVDVAIGKARTAALIKAPSKAFEDMINSGRPSMATTPGLLPLQGGIPIVLDGEVVGAVGVSGSSGDNDQAVALLIADSFSRL